MLNIWINKHIEISKRCKKFISKSDMLWTFRINFIWLQIFWNTLKTNLNLNSIIKQCKQWKIISKRLELKNLPHHQLVCFHVAKFSNLTCRNYLWKLIHRSIFFLLVHTVHWLLWYSLNIESIHRREIVQQTRWLLR